MNVILPEMLEAGLEALNESRRRNLTQLELVAQVFLAMRAIEEIYDRREANETRH